MKREDFKEGTEWALRSSSALGETAQRVALVAVVKRGRSTKVKIRHVEGELEGLEEFVNAMHLRCRWREWVKVERDEKRELALIDHVEGKECHDGIVVRAAAQVLYSTKEDIHIDENREYTRIQDAKALDRVADRAGIERKPWRSQPAFKDRNGALFVPNDALVRLAIAFARAEPETVNLYLDLEEEEYLQGGFFLGERWQHDVLLEQKPAWVIARRWASPEEGRDYLREQVRRLLTLLHRAIDTLDAAGLAKEARRLERTLSGIRIWNR